MIFFFFSNLESVICFVGVHVVFSSCSLCISTQINRIFQVRFFFCQDLRAICQIMHKYFFFRCRVGLHWLSWGEPTLVALFVHRFRDSVPCHVDHQRFPLLSNDLFMRQNRHYGKGAFNHRRIRSIHQIMARITVRIQVRKNKPKSHYHSKEKRDFYFLYFLS